MAGHVAVVHEPFAAALLDRPAAADARGADEPGAVADAQRLLRSLLQTAVQHRRRGAGRRGAGHDRETPRRMGRTVHRHRYVRQDLRHRRAGLFLLRAAQRTFHRVYGFVERHGPAAAPALRQSRIPLVAVCGMGRRHCAEER